MGTKGVENKMTILGIDENGREYFLKYGETKISQKNILNEITVLRKIGHLSFVPKIIEIYKGKNFISLKSSVLKGRRGSLDSITNDMIIDTLLKINNLNCNCCEEVLDRIKVVFSHGDFCPWNMMVDLLFFLFY